VHELFLREEYQWYWFLFHLNFKEKVCILISYLFLIECTKKICDCYSVVPIVVGTDWFDEIVVSVVFVMSFEELLLVKRRTVGIVTMITIKIKIVIDTKNNFFRLCDIQLKRLYKN